MTLGPLMLDVEGCELCAADRELLEHPAVGGVILFARNFESPRQVTDQFTCWWRSTRRAVAYSDSGTGLHGSRRSAVWAGYMTPTGSVPGTSRASPAG